MLRTLLPALAPMLGCLALAFGLAACKKPEYPACKKDKHCKVDLGEKCVDGSCQNCTKNEDCADKGDTCIQRDAEPAPISPLRRVLIQEADRE